MKPRTVKASEVTFTLEIEPEEIPFEGNAIASGDDSVDEETNQWIRDQLNAGNDWAWCCVKVTAEWNGYTGVDYLGGCSYRSEKDFMSDGYYADMKSEALDRLYEEIQRHVTALRPLL